MPDPAQRHGADGFPPSGWTPPAGPGGGTPPPPTQPPGAPPQPPPTPRHAPAVRDLSGRPLSEVHDLRWPKEVDGVEIRAVEMRRLSTGQLSDAVDAMRAARAAGEPASDLFPIFYRVDGARLTDDEWNALDPDDTDALAEKGDRFLPARYRTAGASGGSTPPASDIIASSSAA